MKQQHQIESPAKPKKKEKTVQEMVVYLLDDIGMKAQEISDAMDGRVSTRTIYRWAKGESLPQNNSDLDVLKRLYVERTPIPNEV
jgi:hypothetical protein